MKLTEEQKVEIEKAVDELFFTLKAKILGRFFKGPRIFFEIVQTTSPLESIEGLFRYTYQTLNPGKEPPEEVIKKLALITGTYIEAERIKTHDRIVSGVEEAKTDQEAQTAISIGIEKATQYIDMLVNNEARVIQSYAEKAGIGELAADLGIEDPTVAKLGVIDERMCKVCRKLWHTDENIRVPKVYKLSELAEGYNKNHKNPIATIGPSHPRCRHVMSMIPPNFGFGPTGQIQFKGFGYDIWAEQHGTEKTESNSRSIIESAEEMFDFPIDNDHEH